MEFFQFRFQQFKLYAFVTIVLLFYSNKNSISTKGKCSM